ncbi:MAG TPA: type II toxin-antitoxin system RelE/ParE family toxin [Thermoanaerobaculia bacterium]|jgi:plasmid stabilization system protein ParE|nr:type II toxin-antitoxin system RelE/ParE family toxin [Thermoanaerobaculia bacterium]
MKWIVRAEVADELTAAALWYRDISPSLADAFFAEYEAAIARVQEYPRSCPVVYPAREVRRALMHRFPYALFYRLTDEEGVVFALRHCAQHPRGWQRRA